MKSRMVLFACAIVGIVAVSHDLRADYIVTGDVDLYKEPGGNGKPIGIVKGSTTKTYPTITCRSDKWCQIPGKGWVWGDFVKKVDDANGGAQPGVAPNNAATGSGNKCEGEHSCPDGMVVLDKPNKYGACCEAKEGLCLKGLLGTPPDCTCPEGTIPSGDQKNPCMAKMNCPFPGMTGNPPDCTCPEGTVFGGNIGCIPKKKNCEIFPKTAPPPPVVLFGCPGMDNVTKEYLSDGERFLACCSN